MEDESSAASSRLTEAGFHRSTAFRFRLQSRTAQSRASTSGSGVAVNSATDFLLSHGVTALDMIRVRLSAPRRETRPSSQLT